MKPGTSKNLISVLQSIIIVNRHVKAQPKAHTIIFLLLIFFSFFYSCSSFTYKKHIIGKYYITGVDTEDDVRLSYKLSSGDFIGKAPGKLIEYGYNDSFLIAKSKEHNKLESCFYIIDMRRDSENAHEENFRRGPLSLKEFDSVWKPRLNIFLKPVK